MAGNISRLNGARGGRPKGRKNNATISKEQARQRLFDRVMADFDALIDAQIAKAKGTKHFVKRDKKTGKWTRLRPAEDFETLDTEKYELEIWDKAPATEAFTDLMNRALDKPKEQKFEIGVTDVNAKLALLDRAKERNRT